MHDLAGLSEDFDHCEAGFATLPPPQAPFSS